MSFRKAIFLAGMLLLISISIIYRDACADDKETISKFNASYNRAKSRVMMRVVAKPTRANLDFAAYDRNPIFHVPKPPKLSSPETPPELSKLDFAGSLVSCTCPRTFLGATWG